MVLQQQTALVTGSSQGLGRVIAIALAQAGARVIVNCHANMANAEQVVAEIVQNGGQATAFCCDVSDETAVAAMFAQLGAVDILVNNARIDPYFRTPEDSDAQWFARVLQVNLTGAYICSMAFFAQAKACGYGRIVNVSSVRSFIPAEMDMIAYGVSKLGMHGLTRAFAANGAPYGITANTVAPGMIVTENIDKRLTPEMKARESAKIPLGRGATSEEVADAVLFVIKNGYVTGETININGGMYYAP
ncbi:MAG TPA: SDR family NAD(P)-dependent oxidoreductase [Armatimonadota bacterium]|jgi:3-oxoacyl-[acyl-carrier protein] reductase